MKQIRRAGFFVVIFLFLASSVSSRIGGGDITLEVKKAGDVLFSHDIHAGKKGFHCTQCHDALYITKELHNKATMKQMQKGKSCGECHNGKKAFDVRSDCNACHKK